MYSLTIPRIAVPADGHRDPVRQLKTVRRPPIYPNGAQAISPAAPSPPFRCPHAVHRWIRANVQQVVDETAPELQSAAVDGATLTLAYNEDLDTGATPTAAAFSVNIDGSSRSIDSASVSGTAVTLTLATAVATGDTVTVDYTVPTGESANKLQDVSGNAAESFSGQAVTNNTASSGTPRTVPPPAPGAPNSLKVARHESGKLLASWNAPDSGPAPTGYTLQWKQSADD